MNAILEKVHKARNGFYVHAMEVSDVYELQSIIEQLCEEFREYDREVLIEFICSMELYCLTEVHEDEVYSFDIEEYINELN